MHVCMNVNTRAACMYAGIYNSTHCYTNISKYTQLHIKTHNRPSVPLKYTQKQQVPFRYKAQRT